MEYGTTLGQFLVEEQRSSTAVDTDLAGIVEDMARACKVISDIVDHGDLRGEVLAGLGALNVQGETQKRLDLIANDVVIRSNDWTGRLAGMASEELEDVRPVREDAPRGDYLLLFDPLDGSSNIDVNASIGTIFSVLRRRSNAPVPDTSEFLQPGRDQAAAGYAVYGPSTIFVLTLGTGTHAFTLDRNLGEFVLTRRGVTIPPAADEFAVNIAHSRFWEAPVRRYIEECIQGEDGPRGKDFTMRWIGAMVADCHRAVSRGGVFLHPRDVRDEAKPAKLRLLYEVSPLAFIIEQAGGAASTGPGRALDVEPRALHQRLPLIAGARDEVERITAYHHDGDAGATPHAPGAPGG